ncbi:ATP-Mg/Pi carrier protein [Schizosaccharomyces japonicus yFS275]|uniref:ATP-Mg/Pi carrier protein n=1 Tax=Schizosaccharomyces japonicus (strain yFS275 / FY16936) TaxID=402676 RepID=B6K2L7_SCHJY|nr:ATP-Mg/Pi carrier protein [Schizosaccharomyces japonicus yFS275]EEB07398.1 ATP-Mg/Pi carrier protein [Schizosaccharomyces japonicus yFS275]
MEVPIPVQTRGTSGYTAVMVAGGLGGGLGDLLMHSLDTVKTRQQGALNAQKYKGFLHAYRTIFVEEGLTRGLYGGILPAMMGSLPATAIFFGSYEFSKQRLLSLGGLPESLSYILSGFIADVAASFVYVPSEVLKTRLQLQGRYNNPYFKSNYNYRSLVDAIKQITKTEGPRTFFYGYRATLLRDIPFSGIQFLFYEKVRSLFQSYYGREDIGLFGELITGSIAGGGAGFLTTPLDVAKTRLQTGVRPKKNVVIDAKLSSLSSPMSTASTTAIPKTQSVRASVTITSVLADLYKTEGLRGIFRGVCPRITWTSAQSSLMFVFYESILQIFRRSKNIE